MNASARAQLPAVTRMEPCAVDTPLHTEPMVLESARSQDSSSQPTTMPQVPVGTSAPDQAPGQPASAPTTPTRPTDARPADTADPDAVTSINTPSVGEEERVRSIRDTDLDDVESIASPASARAGGNYSPVPANVSPLPVRDITAPGSPKSTPNQRTTSLGSASSNTHIAPGSTFASPRRQRMLRQLQLDAVYRVAVKGYILHGKDGYDMFAKGKPVVRVVLEEEVAPILPTMVRNHFRLRQAAAGGVKVSSRALIRSASRLQMHLQGGEEGAGASDAVSDASVVGAITAREARIEGRIVCLGQE